MIENMFQRQCLPSGYSQTEDNCWDQESNKWGNPLIELRAFGPLPSRTISSAVAVWNSDGRRSIVVSDIRGGTGELSVSERLEVVGNKGLAAVEAD